MITATIPYEGGLYKEACARIACARKLAQGPLRAIFGLNSEMKSRKEINKQNYQRKRDYIKAQRKLYYSPAQRKLQHDATYSPAQRKLQHDATYSPAQRKLAYIQQKSASVQKVRNEQFCNRSTRSTSTSTSNQAD
eukprot:scaffold8375_cov82-Skeletonema_marinoi.AAC.1